jgi:hypothetical protein
MLRVGSGIPLPTRPGNGPAAGMKVVEAFGEGTWDGQPLEQAPLDRGPGQPP